ENVARKRTVKTAPRLDRRADDDEFGAPLCRDAPYLLAEASGPRADDLASHCDVVRVRDRGCRLEPLLEAPERAVHVCIERQLALDDQGRDQDDARSAVCRQPAREIESVIRLRPIEQRHDDAPIGNRARPTGETTRAAGEDADVRELHFRSWYGTEARITFGSKSRSRFR